MNLKNFRVLLLLFLFSLLLQVSSQAYIPLISVEAIGYVYTSPYIDPILKIDIHQLPYVLPSGWSYGVVDNTADQEPPISKNAIRGYFRPSTSSDLIAEEQGSKKVFLVKSGEEIEVSGKLWADIIYIQEGGKIKVEPFYDTRRTTQYNEKRGHLELHGKIIYIGGEIDGSYKGYIGTKGAKGGSGGNGSIGDAWRPGTAIIWNPVDRVGDPGSIPGTPNSGINGPLSPTTNLKAASGGSPGSYKTDYYGREGGFPGQTGTRGADAASRSIMDKAHAPSALNWVYMGSGGQGGGGGGGGGGGIGGDDHWDDGSWVYRSGGSGGSGREGGMGGVGGTGGASLALYADYALIIGEKAIITARGEMGNFPKPCGGGVTGANGSQNPGSGGKGGHPYVPEEITFQYNWGNILHPGATQYGQGEQGKPTTDGDNGDGGGGGGAGGWGGVGGGGAGGDILVKTFYSSDQTPTGINSSIGKLGVQISDKAVVDNRGGVGGLKTGNYLSGFKKWYALSKPQRSPEKSWELLTSTKLQTNNGGLLKFANPDIKISDVTKKYVVNRAVYPYKLPKVEILAPRGGDVFQGSDKVRIKWKATANAAGLDGLVRISILVDGKVKATDSSRFINAGTPEWWNINAFKYKNSSYSTEKDGIIWNVSKEYEKLSEKNLQLQIEVKDANGNIGLARTGLFTIDNDPPIVNYNDFSCQYPEKSSWKAFDQSTWKKLDQPKVVWQAQEDYSYIDQVYVAVKDYNSDKSVELDPNNNYKWKGLKTTSGNIWYKTTSFAGQKIEQVVGSSNKFKGEFFLNAKTWPDGNYKIALKLVDAAGIEKSTGYTAYYNKDMGAPTILLKDQQGKVLIPDIVSLVPGLSGYLPGTWVTTNNIKLEIADPGAGIAKYAYSKNLLDPATYQATTPTNADLATETLTLNDGVHLYWFYSEDKAGNFNWWWPIAVALRVDAKAPTGKVTYPVNNQDYASLSKISGISSDNFSGVASVDVSVRTADAGQIKYYDHSESSGWSTTEKWYSTKVNSYGSWEVTLPQPIQDKGPYNGNFKVLLRISDEAGNGYQSSPATASLFSFATTRTKKFDLYKTSANNMNWISLPLKVLSISTIDNLRKSLTDALGSQVQEMDVISIQTFDNNSKQSKKYSWLYIKANWVSTAGSPQTKTASVGAMYIVSVPRDFTWQITGDIPSKTELKFDLVNNAVINNNINWVSLPYSKGSNYNTTDLATDLGKKFSITPNYDAISITVRNNLTQQNDKVTLVHDGTNWASSGNKKISLSPGDPIIIAVPKTVKDWN